MLNLPISPFQVLQDVRWWRTGPWREQSKWKPFYPAQIFTILTKDDFTIAPRVAAEIAPQPHPNNPVYKTLACDAFLIGLRMDHPLFEKLP